jgi:radical SAM protein with 4Fe4S-binding SPASM domain
LAILTKSQVESNPEAEVARRKHNNYFIVKVKLLWRVILQRKLTVRKVWIVLWATVSYKLQLIKAAPAPYVLSLEPWNECNAGCLFCRNKKGVIHDVNPDGIGIVKGKMPSEVAIDIIRQLKDDILIAVLYTNGEPMIYEDLGKVVKAASDMGVSTLISSNGLKFTEENSREVLEAGLDFIKVQVSGFTQDIYNIQIRYGDIDIWKENITRLVRINKEGKHGSLIMIDYILYDYNKHELPLMKAFVEDLGLMLNVRPGNPFGGLENKEAPISSKVLPLKGSCDFLWKVMQVNYNGDILPCCEGVVWSKTKPYATFKLGETDIKKVWRSEAALKMRHTLKTKGRHEYDICKQCSRENICFKW